MLQDATPLGLVDLPVVRVDYHGPYLNKIHPAPEGRHTHAILVDSSATPDYRLTSAAGVRTRDSRLHVTTPAPPGYPDPLYLACQEEIAKRNAGGPQGGPFEPWIRK